MPLFRLCHGKCLIHTHRLAREFRSFAEASRLSNLASHAAHARYTCIYRTYVETHSYHRSCYRSSTDSTPLHSILSLSLSLCFTPLYVASFHATFANRVESSRLESRLSLSSGMAKTIARPVSSFSFAAFESSTTGAPGIADLMVKSKP